MNHKVKLVMDKAKHMKDFIYPNINSAFLSLTRTNVFSQIYSQVINDFSFEPFFEKNIYKRLFSV